MRNIYGLLDNLLQWSLIQRNILEHKPVAVNLNDLVIKIIGISNQSAKDKNISIINDIEKDTLVYADSVMLRSIIQNLIFNAIKFTKLKGWYTFHLLRK